MSESDNTKTRGVGLLGMMFLVLFTGKIFHLGEVGEWSWWIITLPLWGLPAAFVGCILGAVIFGLAWGLLTRVFSTIGSAIEKRRAE